MPRKASSRSVLALTRHIYGVEAPNYAQEKTVRRLVEMCETARGMTPPGSGTQRSIEPDFAHYVHLAWMVCDDMPSYGRGRHLTFLRVCELASCCLGKRSGSWFVLAFDGPQVRAYCLDDIATIYAAILEGTTAMKVVQIP